MREIWLVIALVASFLIAAPAGAQSNLGPAAAPNGLVPGGAGEPRQADNSAPIPAADADMSVLKLTADDRILGNKDAPVTIVEYASLTCPHCMHFATDVLPALQKKWIDTGKVKLVMRDYPLDGLALKAAQVARCAPPDKFYAFIDTLFQTQEKWATAKDPQAELQRLALMGGMNKKQFDDCLADKKVENEVVGSRLVATQKLNVNATPTFFINGTKFDGEPSVEAFDAVLDKAVPKS
jgi:protein-disulfide isomerase